MKLLVLGGTQFVGLHIVRAALAAGHQVDVFSRGRTPAPPGVGALVGDRDGDLSALDQGRWDAVIDVSAYVPRQVRATAERLSGRVGRYLFISTCAVYRDMSQPMLREDAPLRELEDPTTEVIDGATYGPLKVACERTAEAAFAGPVLHVRPTYVVGPNDTTDRFNAWLRRVRRGGRVAAPFDPATPTAFVDVRDLGRFTVRLAEGTETGAVHVSGPEQPVTWGEVLERTRELTGSDAAFSWVSAEALRALGHGPGAFPMAQPIAYRGAAPYALDRAHALGLTHTPLDATIRDTLAWDDLEGTPTAGLSDAEEADLLAAWDARSEG